MQKLGVIDEMASPAAAQQGAVAIAQVPGWYTLRRMTRLAHGFRRYFFAGMFMTVGTSEFVMDLSYFRALIRLSSSQI
jgi:hypothetical protein